MRSVRILSCQDEKGGDWVYSIQRCFPSLEEIVFEMEAECESQFDLDEWWERVVDALREGRGAKRGWLRVGVRKGEEECLTEAL